MVDNKEGSSVVGYDDGSIEIDGWRENAVGPEVASTGCKDTEVGLADIEVGGDDEAVGPSVEPTGASEIDDEGAADADIELGALDTSRSVGIMDVAAVGDRVTGESAGHLRES